MIVLVLAGLGGAHSFRLFNRPPKADFSYRTPVRTLKYINPTSDDTILFINSSTDPDGDSLSYSWLIDGKLVNRSRDHWTRLSSGNHTITLRVSDGVAEISKAEPLVVEASEIYQGKLLKMSIKGMKYHIGRHFLGDYGVPPTEEEAWESLWVIRHELGCNLVDLMGDYEDVMLKCAEMALQLNFDFVVLDPYYQRSAPNTQTTIDEHVQKIEAFSKNAEDFRLKSRSPNSIILSVGNELTNHLAGVTYDNLNAYLDKIVDKVRGNFHGKITYLAANQQAERFGVDWRKLNLDLIAPHMYFAKKWVTEDRLIGDIYKLKEFGKPFYSSEFGCETWLGASQYGGQETPHNQTDVYSQEEQAQNIAETMDIYQKANLEGATLWVFLNKWPPGQDLRSMGILKYNGATTPSNRKLGYYMYKSYVLVNSSPTPESTPKPNATIPTANEFSFKWLTGAVVMAQQMPSSREVKARWRAE